MAQQTKTRRKTLPRQHQDRQPGIESAMTPRPRADDPGYHGSSKLRGKVALAFRFEPMNDQGQSQWHPAPGRWSPEASLVSKAKWAAERGAAV